MRKIYHLIIPLVAISCASDSKSNQQRELNITTIVCQQEGVVFDVEWKRELEYKYTYVVEATNDPDCCVIQVSRNYPAYLEKWSLPTGKMNNQAQAQIPQLMDPMQAQTTGCALVNKKTFRIDARKSIQGLWSYPELQEKLKD